MAVYTMCMWEVVDEFGYDFMKEYPIFNEAHRTELNRNIVDSFFNEEIGQETVEMFMKAFKVHMRLNMPVFNKLYELELVKFDPMVTTLVQTDSTSDSKGKTTSTNKSDTTSSSEQSREDEGNNLTVAYAFPQLRLSGNKDYATSAGDSFSENTSSATGSDASKVVGSGETGSENNEQGKTTTKGYNGLPADLIASARANLISVDLLIVESLRPLFINVWGTPRPVIGRY